MIYTVKKIVCTKKSKKYNKKMIKDTVRVNWMTKETFLYYDNSHLKSNDLEMDVETVFFFFLSPCSVFCIIQNKFQFHLALMFLSSFLLPFLWFSFLFIFSFLFCFHFLFNENVLKLDIAVTIFLLSSFVLLLLYTTTYKFFALWGWKKRRRRMKNLWWHLSMFL